ncbi:hypothetical protein E3N88_15015 [Mikania micrantha]|uniref:Cyclin N-terminal domain-containing protein n=1 Tax=Mikania micrantha TaxID=192012 RepID=A0A5N6P650_9ASTR|nr:hypothetical protein E3N88_15015 [Mikania micrantha]
MCDNSGAIAQAKEPRSHHSTKHILRKFHYIREILERGDITINKVHTDHNLADPFTKPMPQAKHEEHARNIELAIQLLCIACLSVAAKMEKHIVPSLSHYKAQGYNFRMELMVSKTLEWKIWMCGFTYLRLNGGLFEVENWRKFVAFVKKDDGCTGGGLSQNWHGTELTKDDDKRKYFKKAQEAARKDVKRAFGVLKKKWHMIDNPCRIWHKSKIRDAMYACIILHNMILEDKGKAICQNYEEVDPPVQEVTPEERVEIRAKIRSKEIHNMLKGDLVEHVWKNRGENL